MLNKAKIIDENKSRLKLFTHPYSPITGEGSLIEREKVLLSDLSSPMYLPKDMLEDQLVQSIIECGSIHDFAKKVKSDFSLVYAAFVSARFEHDFEYYAYQTLKIQHKTEYTDIPFVLRIAQQILLVELEKMRRAGVPIRIVLLKARQWGGSTLIQMYMFWIQQVFKENWHLAVCAQDDGAAKNISEMYRRAAEKFPEEIAKVTFRPYARSPKNTVNVERGGIIGVGSVLSPDQFRSYNYAMCHLSECGIWEDTPKRTAAQLVQSLRSVVPRKAYTLVAIESTAKSVGTFFHDEWIKAEKGQSAYKGVFIPWFKIDMYQEPIKDYRAFIDTMQEYDWFMWEQGATLEGINWYNSFKIGENYDDWQMHNEFPTTPEEAFISGGQRYFAPHIVINARKNVSDPSFIGTIHPVNPKGREDIKESEFVKATRGPLSIWKMPQKTIKLKGIEYYVTNRYCVFGDIGGTYKGADYSSLTVLDRFWMTQGGFPELAADWHGHLDQDLFAWVGVQLAWLYNQALYAIETNSLRTERGDGDHFYTILDNIKDHYDNLFIRNVVENIGKDWQPKYGFQTNRGSKEMILSSLRAGLREGEYVEHKSAACDEFDWYERKKDGSIGAIDGKNDDQVITRAGAYWLATKYMDPPKLVPYISPEERKRNRGNNNRPISEAVI